MSLIAPLHVAESGDRLTWIKRTVEGVLHPSPVGVHRRPQRKPQCSLNCPPAISTRHTLAAALRPLDPDAHIALDAARGRLEVISTATAVQVQDALQEIGCVAKPLDQDVHISGGSTCCGQCS
ncbi:MAG: hypothetical protein LH479_04860 [Polaromonas sp.]|nr:hypothetical protein [Polaromonas sp.]